MDPLDDVFAAMRVQSAVYARLEVSAPWGLSFAPGTSARFGLVVRGGCWLQADGQGPPTALAAGDCYVLPRGTGYTLRDAPGSPTRSCAEVVRDRIGGVIELGGGGVPATVITGWFVFDTVAARPLMNLVPALVHVRMDQQRTQLLQATLQLFAMETSQPGLGSSLVVSRLADIIFVQAIRAHVAAAGDAGVGWLAALSDRRIGGALAAMHRDLAKAWTVDSLADHAGLSRSAFALRFRERVGESPAEYLTQWRMFRAGCLLRQSEQSLGEIASQVGYESEAAFSKAFKRTMGEAPGGYRRRRDDDGPPPARSSSHELAVPP